MCPRLFGGCQHSCHASSGSRSATYIAAIVVGANIHKEDRERGNRRIIKSGTKQHSGWDLQVNWVVRIECQRREHTKENIIVRISVLIGIAVKRQSLCSKDRYNHALP